MEKPKAGIFSLTGCAGDQLMILNLDYKLLQVLEFFSIKSFQEVSSHEEESTLDIAFVEGSVSTKTDLERLKKIREKTRLLIAIGDCAIGGCVQASRIGQISIAERMKKVYGTERFTQEVLEPKGLADYVKVDVRVPGCPIEKNEISNVITSLLVGDMSEEYDYPVCIECKLNEYPCVLVEKGLPCLGPVITAGCNALCPGLNLDCIGCRGPIKDETNAPAELDVLLQRGYQEKYIINRLRFFCGNFEQIPKLTEVIRERTKKLGSHT
jgi:sulfhydrogenase subunit delta